MKKFTSILLLTILMACVATKETQKQCESKCVKAALKKDPDAIEAIVWHECHWACEKKAKVSLMNVAAPILGAAKKNDLAECKQPKCYDKCYCEQVAKGETVEAVIWHICTWQCGKSLMAAPINDQKCWDDCEAEAKASGETNPSVVYQICFFKCGPKPSLE